MSSQRLERLWPHGVFLAMVTVGFLVVGTDAQQTACPPTQTFEQGLGSMTQSNADDINWSRRSGSTPSFQTGPSADFDPGNANGYYMYTEASNQRPGQTARLESPVFNSIKSGQTCNVTFAYHMYGNQMGTLKVSAVETDKNTETVIWSKTGNQGNRWFSLTVRVPSSVSGPFKVILETFCMRDHLYLLLTFIVTFT
jgi:hypothetical protein